MIRIGAGSLAGRIIEQPKTFKTRPLTSKARASIFNRLGDISDLTVLDAYAGSGAFGIEALSLGVRRVSFIEHSKAVAKVIADNLEKLELVSNTTLYVERVKTALNSLQGQSFDVILADPPYAELNESELNQLTTLLSPKGILVISHSSRIVYPMISFGIYLDTRVYGETAISYYRGKIG